MRSRDFCFWLQGFFELDDSDMKSSNAGLTGEQVALIKSHLALVFKHEIDPSMGNEQHQTALNNIHTAQNHLHVDPFHKLDPNKTVLRC